jgi:site-specific recombinase XerD
MAKNQTPRALFDTLASLDEPAPACVSLYLEQFGLAETTEEYRLSQEFLASYAGSQDTFNAYRKEIERLLQWAWIIVKKPIKALDRNDVRRYIEFASHPPADWLSDKSVARFLNKNGERIQNTEWRPFVVRIGKAQRRSGQTPQDTEYRLTNPSMRALFAGLSTFFTFLQQESYIEVNPVQLIRQKGRFLQKQQSLKVTRKLSDLQWRYTIDTIQKLADDDTNYERHLFMMSAFYLLGLRISELAETPGRIPAMGDFAPDKQSRWWFTTVGKGNKMRDIAVPDTMLSALKRYRISLQLSPLPARGEPTPLLNKLRGRDGLGTRQIRNLVQFCFDQAILSLARDGLDDEAQDLTVATVHWLRHTAISADVEHRPREHVRDDAGHENISITDRYIDIDRIARHDSARHKALKPSRKTTEAKEKTC